MSTVYTTNRLYSTNINTNIFFIYLNNVEENIKKLMNVFTVHKMNISILYYKFR